MSAVAYRVQHLRINRRSVPELILFNANFDNFIMTGELTKDFV